MKSTNPIRIGEAPSTTRAVPAVADSAAPPSAVQDTRTHADSADGRVPLPARTRRGSGSNWLEKATQPVVCATVVGLSLALLIYSAVVGSSMLQRPSPAAWEASSAALVGGAAIQEEALQALREDVEVATTRLIGDRQELKAVFERLENEARKRGWNADITVSPAVISPDPRSDLRMHPAIVQLSPVNPSYPPGYASLVEWLKGVTSAPKHTEVTGLHLNRIGTRPWTVRVEVQVLARNTHDQTVQE